MCNRQIVLTTISAWIKKFRCLHFLNITKKNVLELRLHNNYYLKNIFLKSHLKCIKLISQTVSSLYKFTKPISQQAFPLILNSFCIFLFLLIVIINFFAAIIFEFIKKWVDELIRVWMRNILTFQLEETFLKWGFLNIRGALYWVSIGIAFVVIRCVSKEWSIVQYCW